MTLRMRVLPRFPAKITGTNGLTVERPAGTPDLIVKPDFGSLVQIPSVGDGDNVFFMAWDRLLELYRIMSFNDLFSGVAGEFMPIAVYDPQGKNADAFARANHTGVQAISTITGLQTALDGKIPLSDGVRYDASQTNTAARQAQARANISAALKGQIFGLTLSNNASDATNDIDIAAGEAASTETDPVLMVLASTLTKRLDAAWAVGTGNGGLDTGTIANTTYHIWLIQRSDTGVVDALFSTSATAPTMPTNYDRKRRIGSIMRVSAAIKAFRQVGDAFSWVAPATDRNSASGVASALLALTIPAGVVVRPVMTLDINASTTINIANLLGDAAAGVANVIVQSLFTNTTSASDTTTVDQFFSNTSSQIYFACTGTGTIGANKLTTIGYIDTRGRI